MTSVARDHILMRHQSFQQVLTQNHKIEIIGCKSFLMSSLNYLNIISYFYQ